MSESNYITFVYNSRWLTTSRYWVALLPQTELRQEVHTLDGKHFAVKEPEVTKTFPRRQPSADTTTDPLPADHWGPTTPAPLGYVVHGRSGDKSSDANVGFFARDAEVWDWMRSTLTTSKIKGLLAGEYKGGRVDRFELPHIHAVHFLLKDHMDRGVNSTTSYDSLAKNVCEYLRAKWVDIPTRYLEKGRI